MPVVAAPSPVLLSATAACHCRRDGPRGVAAAAHRDLPKMADRATAVPQWRLINEPPVHGDHDKCGDLLMIAASARARQTRRIIGRAADTARPVKNGLICGAVTCIQRGGGGGGGEVLSECPTG